PKLRRGGSGATCPFRSTCRGTQDPATQDCDSIALAAHRAHIRRSKERSLEHVPNNDEETVPMIERTPVRAEGGGLAELLLSHLDSAYNLARCLVRTGADAAAVV